jgi:hypothetical protein
MANLIKRFFWVSSGATISLLKQCETEHNKYVGIGATVMMTGILAGISAGYALYTVFWSVKWAFGFGLLWGLMIFNLDRFIILSIKKKEIDPAWKWQRRLKEKIIEVLAVLPRVALAVLLALVITKPLELKLFEKEVEIEMEAMKREGEERLQASLNSPSNQTQSAQLAVQIQNLNNEIVALRQQIKDKQEQWSKAEKEANCECYGNCGSGIPGVGINCKRERDEAELLKIDYIKINKEDSEVNKQIGSKLKQIEELETVRTKLANNARQTREEARGLATRLAAFDRLIERDKVYAGANLVIVLIFILLETAPILMKIFSSYGCYDKLFETAELRKSVGQMKEQIALVDEAIRSQESNEKSRKAMFAMQDDMLEEIRSEMENSREASEMVRAEWNLAKREFVRQAIATLLKHDDQSKNGSAR